MRILKVDCGFYTMLRAGYLIGLSFCQIELLSQICISRCTTMPVVYICVQPRLKSAYTSVPFNIRNKVKQNVMSLVSVRNKRTKTHGLVEQRKSHPHSDFDYERLAITARHLFFLHIL